MHRTTTSLSLVCVLTAAVLAACRQGPSAPDGATGAARAPSAPAAGAPPPAPPPAVTAGAKDDPCAFICRRSVDLKCKQTAACGETCRQMLAIADCRAQMLEVLRCLAGEPAAHWECGDDGTAAIKDGFCDGQQERFVRCAESAASAKPTPI